MVDDGGGRERQVEQPMQAEHDLTGGEQVHRHLGVRAQLDGCGARPGLVEDDVLERPRQQLTPEVAISGQEVDEVLRTIVESVPAPRN